MKKRLLQLSAMLLTFMLHAQSDALNAFVEQHQAEPAFKSAFISKELLNVTLQTDMEDKDWKKVQQVVKNIGSLYILTADNTVDGVALYKEVYDMVPTDVFSELLAVRDGQTSVRIWVKDEDEAITDLILLVGSPDEFVLVHFYGSIELGNIASLAAMFESAEADDLIQSTQRAKTAFLVSPNPSHGDLTVRYEEAGDEATALTVIDQNGRQVSSIQLSGQPSEQIHLGNLPAGLYWIQMQTKLGKVGVQQVQIVR